MNKEKFKKALPRLGIYIVSAALLAWLLTISKGFFHNIIFWIYIGVMGVSALIVRWYGNSKKAPHWVRWLRHVVFVCFIAMLFFWFAITYILD